MEVHLVTESIKFMILGMGIVFVFLYLLILLMKLQAYIIGRYFSEQKEIDNTKNIEDDEGARVAAIIAAVMEYRKSKGA